MKKVEIWKNGKQTWKFEGATAIVYRKEGLLEITTIENETILFLKKEYDWFCIY